MKSTIKDITTRSVSLLLIGLIGLLIINKSVYLHTHRLNNGTIIEHAHPFDKSNDSTPFKTHHHSNGGLMFFQSLQLLFLVAFLILPLIAYVKKEKKPVEFITPHALAFINLNKGRAPPVL